MPKGWGRDHGEGSEYQQEEHLRMSPTNFPYETVLCRTSAYLIELVSGVSGAWGTTDRVTLLGKHVRRHGGITVRELRSFEQ
jgi:hypothetical protein